jgi:hypothetical protein
VLPLGSEALVLANFAVSVSCAVSIWILDNVDVLSTLPAPAAVEVWGWGTSVSGMSGGSLTLRERGGEPRSATRPLHYYQRTRGRGSHPHVHSAAAGSPPSRRWRLWAMEIRCFCETTRIVENCRRNWSEHIRPMPRGHHVICSQAKRFGK